MVKVVGCQENQGFILVKKKASDIVLSPAPAEMAGINGIQPGLINIVPDSIAHGTRKIQFPD